MEHLTAPWSVTANRAADAEHFPLCIRDKEGWSVAYVTGSNDTLTRQKAQVLAAAPALRDALETCVEILTNTPASKLRPGTADALRKARAALAKARS